ncbi:hypothetical protein B566_EDAN002385 [Ephemera danica]|nr:hypothetical protein B566_EDAN002385 [Ephemera danica]
MSFLVYQRDYLHNFIIKSSDKMFLSLRKGVSLVSEVAFPEIRRRFSRTSVAWANESLTNRNDSLSNNPSTNSNNAAPSSQTTAKKHRGLSTSHFIHPAVAPIAITGTAASKEESREFMAVFPDIVRDLTDAGRYTDASDANKWFSKVLQYNVPGGKKNRGLALVFAFKMLTRSDQHTPENIRLAHVLGWCVEMLQAFFLVSDDMMDNSETRRGRPCWYKKDDVGMAAMNDCILLEAGIYQLLHKYFRDKPYYVEILELFHDVTLKTSMGQSLDLLSCPQGQKPKLDLFTMKRYNTIVKYKTAYYSFQLPVALAMYMAGMRDPETHRQAKTILLEMGHFFQVQDDYLDCFGDNKLTGKKGTDIEDGKCTWLAVVALQRASQEQRALMQECYGSKKPEDIDRVKYLYEELGLPHTYATYEEESFNLISTHIQQISRGLPHDLFFKFMDKIYRRES